LQPKLNPQKDKYTLYNVPIPIAKSQMLQVPGEKINQGDTVGKYEVYKLATSTQFSGTFKL